MEAPLLSELALRSKAVWGYPADFLDACRTELTCRSETIADARSTFIVAERDTEIVGFHAMRPLDGSTFELEALFVEPSRIGEGIGRTLLEDAWRRARDAGGIRLLIQGDPHAAAFYLACGARRTGARESASIPGRWLPLFTLSMRDADRSA
jgi:GNAT superfamily N-acetyltransferase